MLFYIVPGYGRRLHKRIGCAPRWHHHEAIDYKTAIRLGFTLCKRCFA